MQLHIFFTKCPFELEKCLDSTEYQRFNRFQFEKERSEYAFAHSFKRHILSQNYPEKDKMTWQFFTNKNGKPFVKEPLSFNLSHSSGAVALAVLKGNNQLNIGIDIEVYKKREDIAGLTKSVLHRTERNHLTTTPNINQGFLKIWTAKESLLKAVGCGLDDRLNTINCAASLDDKPYIQHWRGKNYKIKTICLGWGALSVCWQSDIPIKDISFIKIDNMGFYTSIKS
ncbi:MULTISPECIES: 4'-phosphopantetheinyl transferase family protein [Vibrio]|uniref:4'-phosphopantetheinyl transferase family protein n=1 Tax=Vibrio TaxID=662 RepID=UPI0012AE5D24|nr:MULTISPECIES: 4'-phosphopantetheinyl transferase superfamily protein [Vibrio]EKO3894520.1 4'-phosphopantetheinyl transferase superfamily protein [Vibrio metschnikovii]NNN69583.1 4'-phosphopantetheinyl transferase superfamily protein [Vibrio sp. 3-2(1)]